MTQYTCNRRGDCSHANSRRPFSGASCPICGQSDVSPVRGNAFMTAYATQLRIGLAVLVAVIILVLIINPPRKRLINSHNTTTTISTPPLETNPTLIEQKVAAANLPPANPELFAVIEIGAKGVKGVVVNLAAPENDPKCQTEDTYSACLDIKALEPFNVNPIEEKAFDDTVKAAKTIYSDMLNKYTVDPSHIYLVASSSINDIKRVTHLDRLQVAVENALDKAGKMSLLKAEDEGQYGFDGVLNMIPKKWRTLRRKQAVLLDIGSGDTKGAYQETHVGERDPTAFGMPWGTKTFTKEINNQRGDTSFSDQAQNLQKLLLQKEIRDLIDRKQGLDTRGRVYLIGGISWAVTTLIQPDKINDSYPKIFPQYFDTLYHLATSTKDPQKRLCTENPARTHGTKIAEEIDKVCQVFTIDNLIAGLLILKTFSQEMQFEHKKVFFIRDSLYAWPIGFIKAKCKSEKIPICDQ